MRTYWIILTTRNYNDNEEFKKKYRTWTIMTKETPNQEEIKFLIKVVGKY